MLGFVQLMNICVHPFDVNELFLITKLLRNGFGKIVITTFHISVFEKIAISYLICLICLSNMVIFFSESPVPLTKENIMYLIYSPGLKFTKYATCRYSSPSTMQGCLQHGPSLMALAPTGLL